MPFYLAAAGDSVATGALRLRHPNLCPQGSLTKVEALDFDLSRYVARWHAYLNE